MISPFCAHCTNPFNLNLTECNHHATRFRRQLLTLLCSALNSCLKSSNNSTEGAKFEQQCARSIGTELN